MRCATTNLTKRPGDRHGTTGIVEKRSRNAAAVITGAGSGIGAALATELARRGGRIVCSDIDENAARTTADAIIGDGGSALAVRCDVTRIDDVQRRYNKRIQKRLTKTTWMSGCSSWYLTADGFNASMYPGFATQYLQQMRDFRFGHYVAVAQGAHAAIGAGAGA